MRLRSAVIRALNLFTAQAQDLGAETVRLGQALAAVATLGCSRPDHPASRRADRTAPDRPPRPRSRRAQGVIAERHRVDMDDAFTLLRASAPTHNRCLADLSPAVVEGSETV
jgi:ANTAR domain